MEQTEGTPRPPLSPEHDADCSQKADDTPETEEEELNEEGDESLHKNQGGQTSVSEKQMNADGKCSEEVVQDELPRKVISLPPKSAPSSPESIVNTHSANQYGETFIPVEGLLYVLLQSAKCIPNMTADTDSDWRKETVTRASSSFDSPDEFSLRESKKRFPSTAADPTPGQSQDNTRGTALYATAGPSTLPLSTKDYKDSDSAAFYDRKKGVELPGSTVGHYKPPRTKNSVQDLRGSSTREKQKEQATHNILPYPGLLDVSPLYPRTSNWKVGGPWTKNSVQDLRGSNTREKQKEQATHNILPYPGLLDVSPLYPRTSNWKEGGPWTKNSVQDLRGSNTREKQKEQASPNILPYPGLLDVSPFYPHTSNWNDFQMPFVKSGERLPPGFFPLSYFPSYDNPLTSSQSIVHSHSARRYGETFTPAESCLDMPVQSAKCIPNVTADTDSDCDTRHKISFGRKKKSILVNIIEFICRKSKEMHSVTAAYARPGQSKDNTRETASPESDSDCDTSERSKMKSALKHKKKSQSHSSRRKKKSKKSSPGVASTVDSSDFTLDRPPPGPLRETVIETPSTAADATPGHSQDKTRETELHATAGPSTLEHIAALDDSLSDSDILLDNRWSCSPDVYTAESGENRSVQSETASGAESDAQLEMETSLTDVKSSVTNTWQTESAGLFTLQQPDFRLQSPAELSDLDPELELLDDLFSIYSSAVHTAGSGENINLQLLSVPSECEAGGDADALAILEAPVTAVSSSATNTQPTRPHLQLSSDPGWSQRGSSCLPRSHSVPSLSQISSAENKTFRSSESLPGLLLKSSFEEFTPDVTVDENDETYRFLCSCPGLYQCSVTGLVFHMEGEGHVVYRIVSWDRRLLAQHHKKPAGPLFDIKCLQQSVCRLHLPHCEIRSTAGCGFLSVAHVKDEGIEFIPPHKITETHVIINITGFSGFGNVKDEDSPLVPVRALVLLFYRPPDDQTLESLLNVLMLPGNVMLRDVQRTRKKLVGDELYIETSPHCKLLPKQEYTLSTCPEDDSVLVQPTTAEFYCDNYDNYFTSFQVDLEKILKHIKLFLRDTNRHSVWERRVCLSSAGLKKSCDQSALNLPPNKKLFDVRSSFIEGISGPVLKSLLDKLLEKTVLTDPERESVDEMQNKRDKARFVIDTVRKKGDAASSEMVEILCELDPFLCEHLGLV